MRACTEFAADSSGSRHREMKHVLLRRPNAGPQARRWQLPGTPQLTARDAHEKRGGFRAAPAASLAGHVGPRAKNSMTPSWFCRTVTRVLVFSGTTIDAFVRI